MNLDGVHLLICEEPQRIEITVSDDTEKLFGPWYQRHLKKRMIGRFQPDNPDQNIFQTFRNNASGLRARTRQDGNTPAKLIRNEFGASAGGPVWFPKLYNGRNKTFWFFAYEGLRQREATFDEDYVPTPAMFQGNFSNIFDTSGVQTHIYDPLTTNAQGVATRSVTLAGTHTLAASWAETLEQDPAVDQLVEPGEDRRQSKPVQGDP